jgi:hypothetical protein
MTRVRIVDQFKRAAEYLDMKRQKQSPGSGSLDRCDCAATGLAARLPEWRHERH